MSDRIYDLLVKLIIVLSLEYLLFFGFEAILPGFIFRAFNVNILLFLLLIFIFLTPFNNKINKVGQKSSFLNIISIWSVVYFLIIFLLVQHNVPLPRMIIYTIIIFITGGLLLKQTLTE